MKKRGNGQGTAYKVGKTYRGQVTRYVAGRRLTASQSGFATKREALEWCALNGVAPLNEPYRTFDDVYSEWSALHYPTISEKKATDYKRVYTNSTELYDKRIKDLQVSDFQSVVNQQKETYYCRKLFKSVYSMMSDYAIRCGYITNNVAELITLPTMQKPNKRAFTTQEIDSLWEWYTEHHDLFSGSALIMIYTGMRYGEISTINPVNIHLQEGYMTGGIKTEAGKTGDILITDRIKPLIADILLPTNRVAEYTAEGFRHGYNRMQESAGISRHTVHECRHTTATLLAEKAVHPAVIASIMRHTNYAQTMEYTHVSRAEKLSRLNNI